MNEKDIQEQNKQIHMPQGKNRYYTAVLYPESMIENWKELIGDIVQLPYFYCLHDKDIEGIPHHGTLETQEPKLKKPHIHLVLCFNGPTTPKRALELFQELQPSCNYLEVVKNMKYMYEYVIHNTETCKQQKKHLYEPSERITGNGFLIEDYTPMTTAEQNNMAIELANFIKDNKIDNFMTFFNTAIETFGGEYFAVIKTNSGFFERLTRGNFLLNNKAETNCYKN